MPTKQEYTAALRRGVQEFKRLRKEQPAPLTDLSGVDLSNCDLRMVDLGRIDLHDVDFRDTDLTGANLGHADLRGARFGGATLVGVNLHKAELEGADFRGARLGGFDEQDGRVCLNALMFRKVRWSREQIEYLIGLLNASEDWEITFSVQPRRKA